MEAFIIGSKAHYQGDEYWPDGRLLKICPKGVRTRVLLEVEASWSGLDPRPWNHYKLYRHRTSELTDKYKGRLISTEWVIEFIRNNKSLAAKIASTHQESEPKPDSGAATPAPVSMSDEELQRRRDERHTVVCFCRGEVESCVYCYGAGHYQTDGFGKRM